MSNPNLSRRYSNEFKESIVSLHQTGRSANSLVKEYGVSVSSITLWIKQAVPNYTDVLSVNGMSTVNWTILVLLQSQKKFS